MLPSGGRYVIFRIHLTVVALMTSEFTDRRSIDYQSLDEQPFVYMGQLTDQWPPGPDTVPFRLDKRLLVSEHSSKTETSTATITISRWYRDETANFLMGLPTFGNGGCLHKFLCSPVLIRSLLFVVETSHETPKTYSP